MAPPLLDHRWPVELIRQVRIERRIPAKYMSYVIGQGKETAWIDYECGRILMGALKILDSALGVLGMELVVKDLATDEIIDRDVVRYRVQEYSKRGKLNGRRKNRSSPSNPNGVSNSS